MPRPSPQTERLIVLMRLLADEPTRGRSLAEIARFLGVTKSTCYPMVITLVEAGWLVRHPVHKTYLLGPALTALGRSAALGLDVVALSHPAMVSTADATGLTCIASVPSDEMLVLSEIVHPEGRRGSLGSARVGDRFAVIPPAGFGLAAWYAPAQLTRWLQKGATRLGVSEARLREVYEPVMARARERGYVVERITRARDLEGSPFVTEIDTRTSGRSRLFELSDGLAGIEVVEVDPAESYVPSSISATVLDSQGTPAMVLSVVAATDPLPGEQVIQFGHLVRDAAAGVSSLLRD